jgi:hypothetical protein
VELPRASTSGGQSAGGNVAGVVDVVEEEVAGVDGVFFLLMAAQEAKDVQDRQLGVLVSYGNVDERARTYGLPSFPSTTPLGNFLGLVSAPSLDEEGFES